MSCLFYNNVQEQSSQSSRECWMALFGMTERSKLSTSTADIVRLWKRCLGLLTLLSVLSLLFHLAHFICYCVEFKVWIGLVFTHLMTMAKSVMRYVIYLWCLPCAFLSFSIVGLESSLSRDVYCLKSRERWSFLWSTDSGVFYSTFHLCVLLCDGVAWLWRTQEAFLLVGL